MATLEFSESPDWREALSAALAARERLTALCDRQPAPDRGELEDAFASWFQAVERVADEIQQAPNGWEHLPRELQWDLPAVEPWRALVRAMDAPDDWCAVWRAWATGEVPSSTAVIVLKGIFFCTPMVEPTPLTGSTSRRRPTCSTAPRICPV